MEPVVLESRFNGPPGSANGGYTCGVVADQLDATAAQVTLRLPPPLGRPLSAATADGRVELRDGDDLVAEGMVTDASLPSTEPVSLAAAAAAVEAGKAAWATDHPFPTCFVCGPEREPADGLSIYPSPLGDGRFAATWTPAADLAGPDGVVEPRYVWAALDCPTAAPCMNPGSEPAVVLARLQAHLDGPVRAGEAHVLVSWPIGADGRKRYAGATLFDAGGTALATSEALWIELRT